MIKKDGRDGAREFSKGVIDVLSLHLNAFPKRMAMHFCSATQLGDSLPRAMCGRIEGAAAAQLSIAHGIDCGTHVIVVRRAETRHHNVKSSRLWLGHAIVGASAKAESRGGRITGGAGHAKGSESVKHPPAQSHCLQHQCSGITAGRESDNYFDPHPLFEEIDGPCRVRNNNIAEAFHTGDGPAVDVIGNHLSILQQIGEGKEDVLGKIAYRDQQQRARLVCHPCVVRLGIRDFRWVLKPPVLKLFHAAFQGFDQRLQCHGTVVATLDEHRSVAGVEQVSSLIVGNECLAGVKAGCRGERVSAGTAGGIGSLKGRSSGIGAREAPQAGSTATYPQSREGASKPLW